MTKAFPSHNEFVQGDADSEVLLNIGGYTYLVTASEASTIFTILHNAYEIGWDNKVVGTYKKDPYNDEWEDFHAEKPSISIQTLRKPVELPESRQIETLTA